MRLADQVAVITGGAQGLGFAYAKRFAEEGATVVIADRIDGRTKMENWDDTLKERTVFHQTDVESSSDVAQLMKFTAETFGSIEILINNAAVYSTLKRKNFYELSSEEWDRIFAVNVKGTFNCIKAVFPYMKAQHYGKIINVASDAIFKGLPFLLHYVSSKGAILAMTRALAKELGPYNVTINAIAPGYTFHEDTRNWNDNRNEVVVNLRCLQRTQTPEDLLGAVVFLASKESDFMTGQTLVVDGGEVFR